MSDDFNEHFSKYYDYIYASKDFKTSLLDYFFFIGLKSRNNVQILDDTKQLLFMSVKK
jgi:hypothetical protein